MFGIKVIDEVFSGAPCYINMSRTRVSPDLRRRPIHNVLQTGGQQHSPEKSSDEDLKADSVVESNLSNVDDTDKPTEQKKGLYPDISEFKLDDSRFVIKQDEHGTVIAGQFTTTTYTGTDSPDSIPTKSESFVFSKVLWTLIFTVLVLTAVVLYYGGAVVEPVKPTSEVTEIVSKLKKEHVNQPSLSFRIIKKALESVLVLKNRTEPSAPAVLLLMSTKGAEVETAAFAEQLAELVASGYGNYQNIYGNQLQTEDPDRAKKEIDNLIKGAPQYNNRHIVVLIRNLDVIPSKAVMMLHGYCDHENAPFKNAVFIMTISTDADVDNCESKHFDEAAESHLTRMWGDLGKDKLNALLSRITVSVAAIFHKTKPALCR